MEKLISRTTNGSELGIQKRQKIKMDNVFDLGKKSYAAAPLPKQSTASDKLKLIFGILCDLIVVTVLSIPFYIQAFIYLIIPKSKKNVAGQVALVCKKILLKLFTQLNR